MRARGAAEPAPLRTGAPSAARLLRGCGPCPALTVGRGAAAGAGLVALVVLGVPPAAGAELSGVFQFMGKSECLFINSTEKMRFVARYIYNREQFLILDSDVGVAPQRFHLAGTPLELPAQPQPPALLRHGFLPCPHPGEVVPGPAGALGARGGHRRGPQRGLDLPAPGAAGNSPPPARAHLHQPEMLPDATRSKMLTGIRGFALGFVFLALGLGFYLRKKSS
ncbi:HLA class II histocompatibility antigen, DO beta chain-like [Haemorhous mexicanus]|uniref:HLA class II histocompatibility antigen, DO beta chain-like n=1 Tax=Haemorhous mexicanus TaxID=30427 RepID=UPI0028BE592A|nr:HLA class II histocompatibility antigen, DO beta chain-like [Haemorhous mexicanus]